MRRLIASCFGLGWLPIAPGTWGSLPPVMAFAIMAHFHAPAAAIVGVMVVFIVAASAACVACVPAVAALVGKTDPGEVVVDEVAGQAAAFLIIPLILPGDLSMKQCCFVTGLGFLLFRVLDISKPWPIKKLEALPAGWGVLADDLLAGVFAAVLLSICVKVWITA
ncbi:MAG: phosphatidylglycerophosphatase A [Phycisphaerales bacterium]|nr:MAG: phosphatidylglycerophosphatase A [Phycisphaerales bacterium]